MKDDKPYMKMTYAKFLQSFSKELMDIDEEGKLWIYNSYAPYVTSEFLDHLYAYKHLKATGQI